MGLTKNVFNRWPRKLFRATYRFFLPKIYARRHRPSRRRREEEVQVVRIMLNG